MAPEGNEEMMFSQPSIKTQTTQAVPNRAKKVAVVLNGNAKAVTDRVIHDLRQVVQDESLFISTSVDQAKFIARHVVNKGYDVVLCGGGDGTFTQCLTDIIALKPRHIPAMGVLRLGTGNALANTLGASSPNLKGLITDLRRAREAEAWIDLPMLRLEGKVAPFAGVGLDSLILSDYNAHKELLKRTPLAALGQGSAGYALSIATRSLWRFVREPKPEVVIRNEGVTAWRMDLQGHPVGPPVPRGGILYSGPVAIAAASSIPFYGLGLRLFPQADRRTDRFQLRVGDIDPFTVLTQLPALFRGELDDPRIHDYFCTAISIHASSPTPFQVGGDEVGRRTSVQIGLTQVQAVRGGLGPADARSENVVSIPRRRAG
jgi:diacylglycerol kinase family enzyme